MKTNLLILFLFFVSITVITSCNSKEVYNPGSNVVAAFNTKYPQVSRVKWEVKQGYQVAEFSHEGIETEAWFDNSGKWLMTESHLKYNTLPQAIREHFETSSYALWEKESIEQIERLSMATIYIIEVENNDQDIILYYAEDGTLIKTVSDSNESYMPLSENIRNQILQKYPKASIIEFDNEGDKLQIDILDNGKTKEVLFMGEVWLSTSWEVSKTEVPNPVMEAFRKSAYEKYRIDDIEFYETPTYSYYYFDLEQNGQDMKLSIDSNGNILP